MLETFQGPVRGSPRIADGVANPVISTRDENRFARIVSLCPLDLISGFPYIFFVPSPR